LRTTQGRDCYKPVSLLLPNQMLFDVIFFGFPVALAICLGAHAVREADARFWRPAFFFTAYSAFYMAGGREVLLYLVVGLMMGGGWLSAGGLAPG